MRSVLILALVLGACTPEPASRQSAAGSTQEAARSETLDLAGRWRILSIDGRPAAGQAQGERAPGLTFTARSVGGTVGCNSFGGLGLLADGHFAIHSWGSTLVGCHGEVGDQERALSKLSFGRPSVSRVGADRVRFESDAHSLELERIGPNDRPDESNEPEELAGTSWRIVMMDGKEASSDPAGRVLRFTGGSWEGMASCATLSGTWRKDGDRILVGAEIPSTEQNCRPDHARIDRAFADLMRSNPRYLTGPNGEVLIAGGGHSLAGGRLD